MDQSRTGVRFSRWQSVPVLPDRGQTTEGEIADSGFMLTVDAYKTADRYTEEAEPKAGIISGLQRKL